MYITQRLHRALQQRPDAIAIRTAGSERNYKGFVERVDGRAASVGHGARRSRGDAYRWHQRFPQGRDAQPSQSVYVRSDRRGRKSGAGRPDLPARSADVSPG